MAPQAFLLTPRGREDARMTLSSWVGSSRRAWLQTRFWTWQRLLPTLLVQAIWATVGKRMRSTEAAREDRKGIISGFGRVMGCESLLDLRSTALERKIANSVGKPISRCIRRLLPVLEMRVVLRFFFELPSAPNHASRGCRFARANSTTAASEKWFGANSDVSTAATLLLTF